MNKQEPIRIAHIMGKMVGGGVESFVMNYYKNIDREKIQFDFIIDVDSTIVPRKEIEILGGKIIEIPPYQKIFCYIKELTKILKENNYKIVHSHLNTLSVFPLFCAFVAKIPVRIAHSHSTTNRKEWMRNIIKKILKPFSKLFATDYFSCSEHAARWLFGDKTFEKGMVTIVHNAIDVEKFKYNEHIREKIRKELNLNDKLVIGHVGRLVQTKNHDFLIDVFSEIYKENSDARLLILGKGPLEDKIKEKIKKLNLNDGVIFLGIKENVNEIMQAMDVFVFPSLYEGLGLVLIEAQCSGLYCVASKEVPEEAILIEENCNRLDLDCSIIKWKNIILENEKNKRIDCSSRIIKKGYSINKEVKKLEKLYLDKII